MSDEAQGLDNRQFMAIVDGFHKSPDGIPGELSISETPSGQLSPARLSLLICDLLGGGNITEAEAAAMRLDAGIE